MRQPTLPSLEEEPDPLKILVAEGFFFCLQATCRFVLLIPCR